MSEQRDQEDQEPPLEPEELDEQDGELLPDREQMTVIDPLGGPMPLDPPSG